MPTEWHGHCCALNVMKNVLIVDDEKSFLLSLLEGLDAYAADFNTLTAQNGKIAADVLASTKIDLVVSDLKMPEMDGFGLLAHMSKRHPNIPVIIMSAYCTPEIKARLKNLGAFTILEKPIDFQEFVDTILAELNVDSKGYIQGITLPAFLQLVEMEKKTCTLKIGSQGRKGTLYFQEGILVDADNGVDEHEKAAFDIVGWEDTEIEIESICRKKTREIQSSLAYVLMEGYRLRDERLKTTEVHSSIQEEAKEERLDSMDFSTVLKELQHEEAVEEKEVPDVISKEAKMATTKEILSELAKIQSVDAVCLVARDGFLLDSIARTGMDTEMIGAIASSGFGASESMGRQLGKGETTISMIEFDKGPVMLSPVGQDAFVVVIAEKDANLGMIRLKLKKHCGELALAAAI
jgi:predicted regulator of Ras-like GTPase activity (Roadblock/LC7/MglB family)/ActR/RegA family two-component response regulator